MIDSKATFKHLLRESGADMKEFISASGQKIKRKSKQLVDFRTIV